MTVRPETQLIRRRDQHTERKAGAARRTLRCRHLVDFRRPRGGPLGGHVSASMLGQVVAAHEAPIAHVTHKLLLAGVCSPVAGELVGAGKLLVAALPVAAEWFLTWVEMESISTSVEDNTLHIQHDHS